MTVIKFDNVSKKYKLYSKGGLFLRDRLTHALRRMNPFNHRSANNGKPSPEMLHPLERDFWALKNVSFEIKQGESVGFIGRNGAGKSTILKLLAGVTKCSSGEVAVNGRAAALIEVGAGFHPELTGRENIFLNASILGMKKVEINKAFDSIVSFAELEDFIDTPVKHYSSGMYVRLGFSIAAHTNPDIFLIDEVLAVGDEAFQKKCLDTLAAHKAAGKTMILVSHNLPKIEEVCDRCIYIDHGEVRHDGLPVMAIERYKSDLWRKEPNPQESGKSLGVDVEIVDMNFLDGMSNEISSLSTGDDLNIEIRYRAHRRIERPAFGVFIHNSGNLFITGVNNRTSSFTVDAIEGDGAIFCRIPNFPLNPGTYKFTAIIADRESERIYDRHDLRYQLQVKSKDPRPHGLIRVQGEWAREAKFRKPHARND